MRHDVHVLLMVDCVSFLKGWRKSKGALTEYSVANAIGLVVYLPGDDIPKAKRTRAHA